MSKTVAVDTKLLRINDAADRLAISTRHLMNLIKDGEITVVQLGTSGRGDRIEESELQRFILRRRTNRGLIEVGKCPSISAVKSGGSSFKSTAQRLDKVLGPPRKPKQKLTSVSSAKN